MDSHAGTSPISELSRAPPTRFGGQCWGFNYPSRLLVRFASFDGWMSKSGKLPVEAQGWMTRGFPFFTVTRSERSEIQEGDEN